MKLGDFKYVQRVDGLDWRNKRTPPYRTIQTFVDDSHRLKDYVRARFPTVRCRIDNKTSLFVTVTFSFKSEEEIIAFDLMMPGGSDAS